MKLLLLIITFVISPLVTACGAESDFEFGAFNSDGQRHQFGEAALVKDGKVIINPGFIKSLSANPTGKELEKNRNELFYLIASGNDHALNVGLKVLINLLQNPEFFTECDTKQEAWNKEEIAFVVSRNLNFHEALCNFSVKEWNLVVGYYMQHPKLWGMIYDPPGIESKAEMCKLIGK